jgi:hypothetical protein
MRNLPAAERVGFVDRMPSSPCTVGDAARGDHNQHVAEKGLGIGHLFEDKSADAGSFVIRMAFIAPPPNRMQMQFWWPTD